MNKVAVLWIALVVSSCAYKNIGEHGPNTVIISFAELPKEVKAAYVNEFIVMLTRKKISPATIINLDSSKADFIYVKSTSIAIIRPGKKIYSINGRRFYIPWNSNREMYPRVLFKKSIYMVYTITEADRVTYDFNENYKKINYLKVDLSKYLKY